MSPAAADGAPDARVGVWAHETLGVGCSHPCLEHGSRRLSGEDEPCRATQVAGIDGSVRPKFHRLPCRLDRPATVSQSQGFLRTPSRRADATMASVPPGQI